MDAQEKLVHFIGQQLLFNSGKSLFYKAVDEQLVVAPSPDTLDTLSRNPKRFLSAVGQLKHDNAYHETLRHIANRVINLLTEANQFLDFRRKDVVRLQKLYDEVISKICLLADRRELSEETLRKLFSAHYANLRDYLEETNGKAIFKKYRERPVLFEVKCANYTADFQLNLLAVPLEEIKGPVMDIGCGEYAELVRFFKGTGIEAVGLDRAVEESEGLIQQNWLEYRFAPDTWGTIISHAAFSTHFIHHHLRADGAYKAYARKYMELLNSLKRGGSFVYAPGLPFIEGWIQTLNEYHVEEGLYATKVTRLL